MGRRKAAKKATVKKIKLQVGKVFKCLFCYQADSVVCHLDIKSRTGDLVCTNCDAKFQTDIHELTEPIDVFTDWLDSVQEKQNALNAKHQSHPRDEDEDYDPERGYSDDESFDGRRGGDHEEYEDEES